MKPKTVERTNGRAQASRLPKEEFPAGSGELKLNLPSVVFEEMTVRLIGTEPLVVHRMGSKALQQIGAGQGIYPKSVKQPKDAVSCFLDTLYRPLASDALEAFGEDGKTITTYIPEELVEGLMPVWARFKKDKRHDRFCFPAHAFREAMGSASMASGMTKDIVSIRRAVHVSRIMLPIESAEPPQMRFDVADVQGKVDLRFRAQFTEWAMTAVIRYPTCMASATTILNLLRLAGMVSGIGEMRNEKKVGTFGSFTVDPDVHIVRVES